MRRERRPSRSQRLVAKAVSLVVHPARNTAAAAELLARMAGGNASVLRQAVARLSAPGSGQPSNVVEEASLLLCLALAQLTDELDP